MEFMTDTANCFVKETVHSVIGTFGAWATSAMLITASPFPVAIPRRAGWWSTYQYALD